MRIKLASLVAAGVIGVAGITGLALVGPTLASATASPVDDERPAHHPVLRDRPAGVKAALAGLVSDGTLTQEQADAVAERLRKAGVKGPADSRGPHHLRGPQLPHGPHLDAIPGALKAGLETAAKALGLTETQLRQALRDGDTLAQVAKEHGVAVNTLVDALVTAATERIDAAVADGGLSTARADKIKADLRERITELVTEGHPTRGKVAPGHLT